MLQLKWLGQLSNFGSNLLGFFSAKAKEARRLESEERRREHIEDQVIEAADRLVEWVDDPKRSNGQEYPKLHVEKNVRAALASYRKIRLKRK